MATEILMPRQGNTVESCVILNWKKQEGDGVIVGDVLCEVETDKASFEVESTEAGVLLKRFFEEGDDIPVLTPIAVVGTTGENISSIGPKIKPKQPKQPNQLKQLQAAQKIPISPRARKLAEKMGIDYSPLAGTGSGPRGRIIESDIKNALEDGPTLAPVGPVADLPEFPGPYSDIEVKGVRKLVAQRMRSSLAETAQLTMHLSADAREILDYRKKLKTSRDDLGLQGITINDLVIFAVSRVLKQHIILNSEFQNNRLRTFEHIHLAFAVDTPRGLTVPVVRFADTLSLLRIATETKRLSSQAIAGNINPDELTGGTITISNLGPQGIELFTPILNPPQVAILGICTIQPKAVLQDGEAQLFPHIGLSLSIDHQAVDGAPAAQFLNDLKEGIASFELLLSL